MNTATLSRVEQYDADYDYLTEVDPDLTGCRAFVVSTTKPERRIYKEMWSWLDKQGYSYRDYTMILNGDVLRLWLVLPNWEEAMRFYLRWRHLDV